MHVVGSKVVVVVHEADDVVESGGRPRRGRAKRPACRGPSCRPWRSSSSVVPPPGTRPSQDARDVAGAHAAAVVADEMGVCRVARELLQVPDLAREPVGQRAIVDVVAGAEGGRPPTGA